MSKSMFEAGNCTFSHDYGLAVISLQMACNSVTEYL